jgi:hypothetical protein
VHVVQFSGVMGRAVAAGLVGAALVDKDGTTISLVGELSDEEAMPIAALVLYRCKTDGIAARLFAGEVFVYSADERHFAVGVARRQLFVVAELPARTTAFIDLVHDLRDQVAGLLPAAKDVDIPPTWGGSGPGGSGGGPAELPLIELGITVPRSRGKA